METSGFGSSRHFAAAQQPRHDMDGAIEFAHQRLINEAIAARALRLAAGTIGRSIAQQGAKGRTVCCCDRR